MAHEPVLTSSAKQTIGAKNLLSSYTVSTDINFNLESQVRLQIRSSPFMHKGFDAYSLGFVEEKAAFGIFP